MLYKKCIKFEILVSQNKFMSNPIYPIYSPNKYVNAIY